MCDMHVCNADGNFPYQVCLNCGLRRGMLWFGIYAWKTKVINILENKTAKKIGSFLYIYGGFAIPFYIVGSIITFLAVSLICLLPQFPTNAERRDSKSHEGTEQRSNLKIVDILMVLSC
jgi:hypothetical protein